MTADLALQALVAAVRKRKTPAGAMFHYDPGHQLANRDGQSLLKAHRMMFQGLCAGMVPLGVYRRLGGPECKPASKTQSRCRRAWANSRESIIANRVSAPRPTRVAARLDLDCLK